jgi:hypothetical protein
MFRVAESADDAGRVGQAVIDKPPVNRSETPADRAV